MLCRPIIFTKDNFARQIFSSSTACREYWRNQHIWFEHFRGLSIHFMIAGLPATKDYSYDLCCPTLKSALEKRTCKICNLFIPSQVGLMVRAHITALRPRIKTNDIPKIRPIRVAARRPWALNIFCFILGGNFDDCGFWRVETWHNQNPLCLPRISAI